LFAFQKNTNKKRNYAERAYSYRAATSGIRINLGIPTQPLILANIKNKIKENKKVKPKNLFHFMFSCQSFVTKICKKLFIDL
jgi:hypothetical protein